MLPLSLIVSDVFIGVGLKYIIPVILFGCLLVTFNERKTRGWYKFYIPVLIYLGYFALHTWVIVSQLHPSASTYFMYARIFRVYMTHMLWHLCLMAGLLPFWIRDWNKKINYEKVKILGISIIFIPLFHGALYCLIYPFIYLFIIDILFFGPIAGGVCFAVLKFNLYQRFVFGINLFLYTFIIKSYYSGSAIFKDFIKYEDLITGGLRNIQSAPKKIDIELGNDIILIMNRLDAQIMISWGSFMFLFLPLTIGLYYFVGKRSKTLTSYC